MWQPVTWNPLSEVLHNTIMYVGDHKRQEEPQDFSRFKTAVVQAAANSAFVAPGSSEEAGRTVCVSASPHRSVRGLALCTAHLFFLEGSIQAMQGHPLPGILLQQGRGERYGEAGGFTEGRSKKAEVTSRALKKLEGLHLPS